MLSTGVMELFDGLYTSYITVSILLSSVQALVRFRMAADLKDLRGELTRRKGTRRSSSRLLLLFLVDMKDVSYSVLM